MSYLKIQETLFDIESKAMKSLGCDAGAKAVEPLFWWIQTDRCPLNMLKALLATNSRQRTTIVKRLAKSGSYDDALGSVKEYLVKCFPEIEVI